MSRRRWRVPSWRPRPERVSRNDESLIRMIGIRLVAEWLKDLVVTWLGNHD
ncbi:MULTISPECIES: hypothetical protein [Actinosynnema]|uniref:hypothetical protein n=1 Tax=Actinosynnema TaxID=40566 RepID=UPI0020A4C18F|nr:hypothetical protein [Actinosynnema pretiosum]MCP2099929.1 hypothetical protein [Actinosynnema pretiosum]